jgi:hypothetical protein
MRSIIGRPREGDESNLTVLHHEIIGLTELVDQIKPGDPQISELSDRVRHLHDTFHSKLDRPMARRAFPRRPEPVRPDPEKKPPRE